MSTGRVCKDTVVTIIKLHTSDGTPESSGGDKFHDWSVDFIRSGLFRISEDSSI
jgi:hypothetical protein